MNERYYTMQITKWSSQNCFSCILTLCTARLTVRFRICIKPCRKELITSNLIESPQDIHRTRTHLPATKQYIQTRAFRTPGLTCQYSALTRPCSEYPESLEPVIPDFEQSALDHCLPIEELSVNGHFSVINIFLGKFKRYWFTKNTDYIPCYQFTVITMPSNFGIKMGSAES